LSAVLALAGQAGYKAEATQHFNRAKQDLGTM
jgi:hypothetical protein